MHQISTNLLVTVIIPFHNAEKTIHRAMESISLQSFENFECILIDNNSTDNSRMIAETQVKNDNRFKLIAEKEQGVVHASNAGAKMAQGKYIARMDADDWSFPTRLEKQVAFLENNPGYGAVAGLVEHAGEFVNTAGFDRYVNWSNSVKTYDEILSARFIEMPLVNPTAMWKKSTGVKYGLYKKGDFPEDYEMWLRWLHHGVKIAKIPEPVLKWYDSPNRLTRTDPLYSDQSFYTIKSGYLSKWLETHNPHHPDVVIWGASKISRQRAKILEKYNINIKAYIDIKRGRELDRPVLYYQDIPGPGKTFILVYMKLDYAKEDISRFLNEKGFTEGENYLHIS